MRVLLKMNGNLQVDKIYELEVLKNGRVMLWTSEDMPNIVVTGVSDSAIESLAYELLREGYVDLSKFHAGYTDISKYPVKYEEDDETDEDF